MICVLGAARGGTIDRFDTILCRDDDSEVKDQASFISHVLQLSVDSGGTLCASRPCQ